MSDKGYLLDGAFDQIVAQVQFTIEPVQFAIEEVPRDRFMRDKVYHLRLDDDGRRAWIDVFTSIVPGLHKVSAPLPKDFVPGLTQVARLVDFLSEPRAVRVVEHDSPLFESCPQLREFRDELKALLLSKFPTTERDKPGKPSGTQGGTLERVKAARALIEQGTPKTTACKRALTDPRTYDRYVTEIVDWEEPLPDT